VQIKEDGFKEVVEVVLAAWDSGELAAALAEGHDGEAHPATASDGGAPVCLRVHLFLPVGRQATRGCIAQLGAFPPASCVCAGFKKWMTTWGKSVKRKGKRLFMPMRIAFTVSRVPACQQRRPATCSAQCTRTQACQPAAAALYACQHGTG
jgi:hypothetical protein